MNGASMENVAKIFLSIAGETEGRISFDFKIYCAIQKNRLDTLVYRFAPNDVIPTHADRLRLGSPSAAAF